MVKIVDLVGQEMDIESDNKSGSEYTIGRANDKKSGKS